MNIEKRNSEKPVPDDITNYLTGAQLAELHHIESFGWTLEFIRRPLFQERVAVVTDPEGVSTAVLEADGRLNLEADIVIRA